MVKLVGYLISVIGIALLVLSSEPMQKVLGEKLPEIATNFNLMVGGGILVLIGIAFVLKSKKKVKKSEEVPIYKGKEIVGYRRH